MSNKYQYEKIFGSLDAMDFSKKSFEELFNNIEFLSESDITTEQQKKKFIDINTLVSWFNYESDSLDLFLRSQKLNFIDVLTYTLKQYGDYAKGIGTTTCSDNICKNHIKNFHPYSFLNRINYYLSFITSKISPLNSYVKKFFLPTSDTGRKFSLNSCPTYPTVMQQTLTLSQFDSTAIRTQEIMLKFLKDSLTNAFLGKIPEYSENQTFESIKGYYQAKVSENSDFFKRLYYDAEYTIVSDSDSDTDSVAITGNKIKVSNFLKYVLPGEMKDTTVNTDFYLQLQSTSEQSTRSAFTDIEFDDDVYDWKFESEGGWQDANTYYRKNIVELSDILLFLSIFIEKLSHIKSFSIIWKHLKNSVETEVHIMSTLTLNYTSDTIDRNVSPNHALYITSVISPIQKRQTTINDSDEQQIYEINEDNFNTNILMINTTDGKSISEQDNLFDSLIYDNEVDDIGNIDDSIQPDIGQFFNTNGTFGAQYFIQRKNNFTLTLNDVRKKFNLYSGELISRKSVLNAIDYIFSIWTTTMSTYTLQIVTCHSNCHMNFGVIQKTISGSLDVTKSVSDTARLMRDYCFCGSILHDTMTIKMRIPDYLSRDYDITKAEWNTSVTLTSTGGTLNYKTKPSKLKAVISIKDFDWTETKYSETPNDCRITFIIPDKVVTASTITVTVDDVDSACGVSEKEYNNDWRYTKHFKIAGSYNIKGTLKTSTSTPS